VVDASGYELGEVIDVSWGRIPMTVTTLVYLNDLPVLLSVGVDDFTVYSESTDAMVRFTQPDCQGPAYLPVSPFGRRVFSNPANEGPADTFYVGNADAPSMTVAVQSWWNPNFDTCVNGTGSQLVIPAELTQNPYLVYSSPYYIVESCHQEQPQPQAIPVSDRYRIVLFTIGILVLGVVLLRWGLSRSCSG